jgi:hypothetical protein
MSAETIYSGPGKVITSYASTLYPIQAEGENGQVTLTVDEPKTDRSTASLGRILSTQDDQIGKISVTPFDSWANLAAFFPPWLGVTTSAGGTGALLIGSRPHDKAAGSANGLATTSIYTNDGRIYAPVRTAITKPPGMKLGVGQPLYESLEITALIDPAKLMGASAALFPATPVTESGGSDPDTVGFSPDFVNGHWTATWGSVTGFAAFEAEDYFQLVCNVKYSPLKVQKLTRHFKLDSVDYMIKCRPVGGGTTPHTYILTKLLAHTLGAILTESSATDLVLSGPSSKTITLKNVEVVGAGFEFGGTRLGTGEIGFVTQMTFSGGPPLAPAPLLIFSA